MTVGSGDRLWPRVVVPRKCHLITPGLLVGVLPMDRDKADPLEMATWVLRLLHHFQQT